MTASATSPLPAAGCRDAAADTAARVALITGGSRGLGLALAHALARDGCVPLLIARSQTALDVAVAALRTHQPATRGFCADVRDDAALAAIARTVRQQYSGIDLLVNNAGVVFPGEFLRQNLADVHAQLETNLWGSIAATRILGPLVRSGGAILFVSSGFGLIGVAGYAAYCASKAGLLSFADALARELRPRNVRVHVALPADIDTPGFRDELRQAPAWLRRARARGAARSADVVAARILAGCRRGRPLVFPQWHVRMLHWFDRYAPRPLRAWALDRLFPGPGPEA